MNYNIWASINRPMIVTINIAPLEAKNLGEIYLSFFMEIEEFYKAVSANGIGYEGNIGTVDISIKPDRISIWSEANAYVITLSKTSYLGLLSFDEEHYEIKIKE